MNALLLWFFNQKRITKQWISVLLDVVFISVSYWGAMWTRLDYDIGFNDIGHWEVLSVILPVTLVVFFRFGLYRTVLRYLGQQASAAMVMGIVVSSIIMVLAAYFFNASIPRTVPIMYGAFALLLCGGSRIVARALYIQVKNRHKKPVIIYGAGSAGRQLHTSLQLGNEYRVVAFVDDNTILQGKFLHGVRVYSPKSVDSLISAHKIQTLLLAMPSESRSCRREIVERLNSLPVTILTIPGIADLVSGKAKVNELQEISIEDLLGRDPVEPFGQLIAANIINKSVMVTGAGGSIGSELCRQALMQHPHTLVLYERSEFALYTIEQELRKTCQATGSKTRIVPVMASVKRQNRLESVLQAFRVNTVYHAAACKHVPMVEYNVVEAVQNNVFGTWRTAEAAINSGVETFVLISTDKAVRPTNVMGTTKRLAELVLQGLALRDDHNVKFSMVRFGNVLGSSGSVVPLFKRQIIEGGPITLTHEEITRYFMTIPEAAQLVIQAGAMGSKGEVFVLDMGESVKIIDLARKMIRLMGFEVKDENNPNGDIEIVVTGLRPGEKLYEELLIGDNEQSTEHPRIRTANEVSLPWSEMRKLLDQLYKACDNYDQVTIRQLLLEAPAQFNPQSEVCDLVWVENNSRLV